MNPHFKTALDHVADLFTQQVVVDNRRIEELGKRIDSLLAKLHDAGEKITNQRKMLDQKAARIEELSNRVAQLERIEDYYESASKRACRLEEENIALKNGTIPTKVAVLIGGKYHGQTVQLKANTLHYVFNREPYHARTHDGRFFYYEDLSDEGADAIIKSDLYKRITNQ